jgi:hypothetical protein
MAALFFSIWPWRAAAAHLVVLVLLGTIVSELSLRHFQKIPFTCSYLPGKSYFHIAALTFLGFVYRLNKGAALERSALDDPARYTAVVVFLVVTLGALRWGTAVRAKSEEAVVQFEDEPEPAILRLGLDRMEYSGGFTTIIFSLLKLRRTNHIPRSCARKWQFLCPTPFR